MALLEKIKHLSEQKSAEAISIRRHLHSHPELSFEEHETSKFVAEKLRSLGLSPQENVGGLGVVALIEGRNPGKKVIGLRADMDALPIFEQNDV
ncbi:MAG: amidohydrolase, partial [Spirosomaceae bacterium]|nr:amidohydrolase [Spirosomataceae bacterium]